MSLDTWAKPGAVREGFQEEVPPDLGLESWREEDRHPRCRGVRQHCECVGESEMKTAGLERWANQGGLDLVWLGRAPQKAGLFQLPLKDYIHAGKCAYLKCSLTNCHKMNTVM